MEQTYVLQRTFYVYRNLFLLVMLGKREQNIGLSSHTLYTLFFVLNFEICFHQNLVKGFHSLGQYGVLLLVFFQVIITYLLFNLKILINNNWIDFDSKFISIFSNCGIMYILYKLVLKTGRQHLGDRLMLKTWILSARNLLKKLEVSNLII